MLSVQGTELVELMRRACFYGQEKGLAESRVTLGNLAVDNNEIDGLIGVKQAAEWLAEKFEEDRD